MDWNTADLEVEVTARIRTFRDDQRAQVQQWEDALSTRERALNVVDQANAVMGRCQDAIAEDETEIDRLLDELPRQRKAE